MAGINMPGKPEGQLEGLMKALSIAQSVYGIKTDMARLKSFEQQQASEGVKNEELAKTEEMKRGQIGAETELTKAKTAQLGKFDQQEAQKRNLELKKLNSEINKNNAYASSLFKNSSLEKNISDQAIREQYKDIYKTNAKLFSVKSGIDAALKNLNDPNVSEDQKIKTGQGLLKLLNSAEGADAIGAEESKRLGSFLEYQTGNFTGAGPFWGRDLDLFTEQVSLKSQELGQRLATNEQAAQSLLKGESLGTQVAKQPEQPQKKNILKELSPIKSAIASEKNKKAEQESNALLKSLGIGL